MTSGMLFDSSVLIAMERGAIDAPPGTSWMVSAMTLAELNIGVLRARTPAERNRRLSLFLQASDTVVLPFDEPTARTYAELVAWSETVGRRPATADAIIAATAATNDLTLVTLDQDFEALADFEGLDVRIV